MPLFVILLLVAAVSDLRWPGPAIPLGPLGSPGWTFALVGAALVFNSLKCFLVVRRLKKSPDSRRTVAKAYARWRKLGFFLTISINLAALFTFGWGEWVRTQLIAPWNGRLFPYAELLVPAPYLAILFSNWLIYWPAERAFQKIAEPNKPFWGPFGYWFNNFRQCLLTPFLPVLLWTTQHAITRSFPFSAGQPAFQIGMSFAVLLAMVFLPLMIRPLLGWQRLPEGPIRERLLAASHRLGVRFAEYYLWPTRGSMANAMVLGVVPRLRFVVFTDQILEGLEPRELEAVFGHEAGHARYGHLPYYFLFLILSSVAAGGALLLLYQAALGLYRFIGPVNIPFFAPRFDLPAEVLPLGSLAGLGIYLFVVFGWMSRISERQADIYGSRTGSCSDPNCRGHDADTVLVNRGRGLCPTGLRSMGLALEKVMHLNGWDANHVEGSRWKRLLAWLRAWQHGPIATRIVFLQSLFSNPELADRHDRYAFRTRLFLILALIGIAAAGALTARNELWEMLEF